jgi:hypothetical protein
MNKLHLTDYDYWRYIYFPAMVVLATMRIYELLEDTELTPEGRELLERISYRLKKARLVTRF